MRVPSIGLPLDERRIVREGYALAERMMRNYEDKPSLGTIAMRTLALLRQKVLARD